MEYKDGNTRECTNTLPAHQFFLIGLDQPGITDNIGNKDSSKPALYPTFSHLLASPPNRAKFMARSDVCLLAGGMSVMGQERTSAALDFMSALPPITDIGDSMFAFGVRADVTRLRDVNVGEGTYRRWRRRRR